MATALKNSDCTETETCVLVWYSQRKIITALFWRAFGMVEIGFGTVTWNWLGHINIPKPA